MTDTDLTAKNARVWAYGFTGEVEINNDGSLSVSSSDSLSSGDYVNVLCGFDRSLFPLASKAEMSFEELRESVENENSDVGIYVLLAVLVAAIGVAVILIIFFSSRYKLADGTAVRLPRKKEIKPIYTVPFGGSIPAVYFAMELLRKGIAPEKLMAAYLIRWQEAGYISIEKRQRLIKGKCSKSVEAIVFNPEKTPENREEQRLYEILIGNATHEGILWSSVIEKKAEKIYGELTEWVKKLCAEGEKYLIGSSMADKDKKGVVRLTAVGFEQALMLLGFEKYLTEIGRDSNSGNAPRELWGNYFVFAVLFGIGQHVLKSMEALDPAYFETFTNFYGCNVYSLIFLMNMTNHISSISIPDTDGTGGGVGGGDFSGGGGGGSR